MTKLLEEQIKELNELITSATDRLCEQRETAIIQQLQLYAIYTHNSIATRLLANWKILNDEERILIKTWIETEKLSTAETIPYQEAGELKQEIFLYKDETKIDFDALSKTYFDNL